MCDDRSVFALYTLYVVVVHKGVCVCIRYTLFKIPMFQQVASLGHQSALRVKLADSDLATISRHFLGYWVQ